MTKTYHGQNIVREPYLLKVVRVDGKNLETPITIEYGLANERVESGIKCRMRAYETLLFTAPESSRIG